MTRQAPIRPANYKPVRITALSQAKFVKLLMEGTHTCPEMATELGLHLRTVQSYCAALHKEGAVYIDHWEADPRGALVYRVFRLGEGKDAVRPVKTRAQRSKTYRIKRKMRMLIQRTAA